MSDYAKKKINEWGTNPACGENPAGNGYTDCSRARPDGPDNKFCVFVLEGLPGKVAGRC